MSMNTVAYFYTHTVAYYAVHNFDAFVTYAFVLFFTCYMRCTCLLAEASEEIVSASLLLYTNQYGVVTTLLTG